MTMSTAGRAVLFSGTAVAIGLALMLFMPLPFMRGFGLAGLLIPLVSVAAAITLLPVLMYWLEDRMDRVRLIPKRVIERREDSESNFWARLADRIMKRPYAFAAATTAALLLLAAPVLTLQLGPGSNEGIPQDLEAVQGLNVLSEAVGEGALAPTDIVIDTGRAGGAANGEVRAGVDRLASLLRGDSEVADVIAAGPQTVDETGRYIHVQAIGKHEYGYRSRRSSSAACATRSSLLRHSRRTPRCSPAAGRRSASTSSTSPTAPSRGSCWRFCC